MKNIIFFIVFKICSKICWKLDTGFHEYDLESWQAYCALKELSEFYKPNFLK